MFKILQKLKSSRSSWYDRMEAKVKYAVYSIMHELLQSQINSNFIFSILLIIESFQFVWYAIHPNFNFLWHTSIANYPREAVKYFQIDFTIRKGSQNFLYVFLYGMVALQLFILICLIFIIVSLEKVRKRSSTLFFYTLKLLSLYALLLSTMGPIPVFQIFYVAIICRTGDPFHGNVECYQGVQMANTVVAVFGLFFLLVFAFVTQLLYIDLNPSSSIPLAAPQSKIGLFKFALKIALPLYATVDYNFNHAKTFIAIYWVCLLIMLVLRYFSCGYYSSPMTMIAIATESLIFWAALCANLHAIFDKGTVDDIGVYYFLFGIPFVSYVSYRIFARQKWRMIQKDIKTLKRPIDVEAYINIVTHLIDNQAFPENRVELEGIVRYHAKFCNKSEFDCPCRELAGRISKDEEMSDQVKKEWYRFAKSLLVERISYFPKSARLHLLYAYLQHDKLNNQFKAIFELTITEDNQPNIQEEYSIFRYRNLIEKEMVEDDIRKNDSRGIDVNQIVDFREKFVSFQGELAKSVNMQLDFWRELEQANPNVQKLLYLGSRITIQADTVRSQYSKLYEINPNHIKMLEMYGDFLGNILNDGFESQRVIEKANDAKRSLMLDKTAGDSDRNKYSENSKTCIITCSGNLYSMGKVLTANAETQDLLEYPHNELIDQNISQIMPTAIGDIHDEIMMKYFETTKGRVMGIERAVYPMTKSGYIVPCNLMIKVYPNLDEGIKVVGFLKRIENNPHLLKAPTEESVANTNSTVHYILYEKITGVIHGVSKSCEAAFGIPASLANGEDQEFTIDSIFPDYSEYVVKDGKESRIQFDGLWEIDTSNLPQNFLIGDDDSQINEEEEEAKKARYRSTKVKIIPQPYPDPFEIIVRDVVICVLRFTEATENSTKLVKSGIVNITEKAREKSSGEDDETNDGDDFDDQRSEASVNSVGSAVGEDVRQLKDMKAKISEKNTPLSIITLRNVSYLLCVALIVITGIQLHEKSTIQSEFWKGLQVTQLSYQIQDLMAESNFKVRRLELLSKYMVTVSSEVNNNEDDLRAALSRLIDTLNLYHFEAIQGKAEIYKAVGGSFYLQYGPIKSLLDDGSVVTDTFALSHATYKYIGLQKQLNTIPLDEFQAPLGDNAAAEDFYYIRVNGLSPLRERNVDMAEYFYQYYYNRTSDFSKFFLVTMIVGIALIIASMVIIIPKTFSVYQTNIQVLSLFGFIHPTEVQVLAERCDAFIKTYLDDLILNKDISYLEDSREEDDSQEITIQPDNSGVEEQRPLSSVHEASNESLQQNYTTQMKEFPEKNDLSWKERSPTNNLAVPDHDSLMGASQRTSMKDSKTPLTIALSVKHDKKDKDGKDSKDNKEEKEEDEELHYYLLERSNKLKNSKVHKKKTVIIQLSSFAALFLAYFIGDYISERFLMTQYRRELEHLKIISQRSSNLRFVNLFALEELAENNLASVYPQLPSSTVATSNYRTMYSSMVYTNQLALKDAFNIGFSDGLNSYLDKLLNYNNGDICALYYPNNADAAQACNDIGKGLLNGGLIQSEDALVRNTIAALNDFYDVSSRDNTTQVTYINSPELEDAVSIMETITPMLLSLISDFLAASNSYFQTTFLWQEIEFLCFIIVLVFVMVFIWLPYLRRLTSQIFRAKGLLNMIPMGMLNKNKSLAGMFTSNELLRAVE